MRAYIMGHKVGEIRLGKTLSEEITHMTKTEENEVTDIGGEQVIIRRLVHHRLWEDTTGVSAGVSVAGMTDRTKLGMLLGQPTSLLRARRLEECGRQLIHVGIIRGGC